MKRFCFLLCLFVFVGCGSPGHSHKHDGHEKGCGMSGCSHGAQGEMKKDSKEGEGGCSGGCKH